MLGHTFTVRPATSDILDEQGTVRKRIRHLPQAEWSVFLPGHHEGFIEWATFEANQARLEANIPAELHQASVALREGSALLQGLAICGSCGRRLFIAYLVCVGITLLCAVLAVTKKNFYRYFYPLYDLGRSVPYLAIFLPLFVTLHASLPAGISQEIASFTLLLLAMVWYLLFNVVTAARALPTELMEVSAVFRVQGLKRVTDIILPGVLPAFITGSLLAWGGGWNVVIYSEYIQLSNQPAPYILPGLGYLLDNAAYVLGDIPLVIFFLFIMSGIVILLERVVWRRLLRRVERFGVEFN